MQCSRCKTCPLIKQAGIVPLPIPQGTFSCRSANVVYAITCTACNAVHIGETGCLLRERMNGHRCSVKHGQDTPVAEHFKKKKHKMAVCVLQGAQEDRTMRRSLEKKWIVQVKEDDRTQMINRDDGADILYAKTFCTHLTLTSNTSAFSSVFPYLFYMFNFFVTRSLVAVKPRRPPKTNVDAETAFRHVCISKK